MTEARQLAYLELVQKLLDSGVGTEDNILNNNLALVDAGLIVVLREVAESLQKENDPDLTAIFDWLINVSNKLVRGLELDTDDEFDFFSDVLAMIGLTNGNTEAIYTRFQSDVLLLNDRLLEIIPAWSKAVFLDSNKQEQELLASFLAIFANMIAQFPLGRRSMNLELAIAGYHAALAGYNKHEFPDEWAAVQLAMARLNIKEFHNYAIAREYLQNTYEHLLGNKYNLDLLAEVMFELAQCLHHIGQLEQAKILLKDTVRLYQRLEKLPQIAAATGALGNLEMQMGKLTNAHLHLQQALDLYESLGRQKNVEAIQRLQEYVIKPIAG
jgi:tetratricopeptide (TPR) repeat protein